jgi:hypothetical protein
MFGFQRAEMFGFKDGLNYGSYGSYGRTDFCKKNHFELVTGF